MDHWSFAPTGLLTWVKQEENIVQGKRFELSNGLTDQALNLAPLTTGRPLLKLIFGLRKNRLVN
jgi:hypothetical protein